jgi:GTPase
MAETSEPGASPAAAADSPVHRSGFVALVGRPNSGKSTLINTVMGEQLCVVSSLPQTTRRNLRGIYTAPEAQVVFIDTPGIHQGDHRFNAAMIAEARRALSDSGVDVVVYVVDMGREFGPEEDGVAALVAEARSTTCVIFNKADRTEHRQATVDAFFRRYPLLVGRPHGVLSAREPGAREAFLAVVVPLLPYGPPHFGAEELTDENMRFFAAEYLREGLITYTREEVPHASCVEILQYRETPEKHYIDAVIHVETVGQRGIIIGKGGEMIGRIRGLAESRMRQLAGVPVSYRCHIAVTARWRDNPAFLKELGYRG